MRQPRTTIALTQAGMALIAPEARAVGLSPAAFVVAVTLTHKAQRETHTHTEQIAELQQAQRALSNLMLDLGDAVIRRGGLAETEKQHLQAALDRMAAAMPELSFPASARPANLGGSNTVASRPLSTSP